MRSLLLLAGNNTFQKGLPNNAYQTYKNEKSKTEARL
jgi:hypothetical protein